MKKASLLLLALFSFSSFGSEKLNCWIESKDIKTNQFIRKDKFKVEVDEGVETKIGELFSGNFFVLVEQKDESPEVTILSKDSTGRTYSATSSQLGGIEQGAIMSSCEGTSWYNRECIAASKEMGAVGCSLARKIKF